MGSRLELPGTSDEVSGTIAIRTLALTDLVGSTRILRRLGDERGSRISAAHDRCVRGLVERWGGQEVDKSDGFFLLFERPIDAVTFALEVHDDLAELSRREGVELAARVGIHVGEVYLRHNAPEDVERGAKPLEVEGLAKPAAARLMSLARGGQTLLGRAAFDIARRAAVGSDLEGRELRWLAHGPFVFKGLDEPVEVFEVGVVGSAPLAPPKGSEKAQSAVIPGDEITLGWRAATGQPIPQRPHWFLQEKLGEGGFGDVWLATHAKTGERRVFKFCYEAERLRALKREVMLFRLLKESLGHRRDIARLLDWSFDEAPYWLEASYTEGGNLEDWAERHGGIGEVPLATRLELVAQVAEALAAAHSAGVLHKDVKPANVLIDEARAGEPRAVLTDFGVGLLADRGLLAAKGITAFDLTQAVAGDTTSTGGGTQIYTAPELWQGEAPTVQADLYALGVMLYQLVVGDLTRALAPGWEREVGDELLREDIATFVDGSPARRPRSALEIAERLRSLEARRRERAEERRRAGEAERARRRRKLGTTAAVVATLFLVVVSVFALQAIDARRDAEQRRGQAEGLIDFMLVDLRDGLEPIGRLDLLEKVARLALTYITSLPMEERSARHAVALMNVGEVVQFQGDSAAALEAFGEATHILEQELVDQPADPDLRLKRLRAQVKLGGVQADQQAPAQAIKTLQRALQEAGEIPEATNAGRLIAAEAYFQLGQAYWYDEQREEARGAYQMAFSLADALADGAASARAPWRARRVALESRLRLGRVLEREDRYEEALKEYRAARKTAERLADRDPDNVYWRHALGHSWFRIGRTHDEMQEVEAALSAYGAAEEFFEELGRHDPQNASWQHWLAATRNTQAALELKRGDAESALRLFIGRRESVSRLAEQDPTNPRWKIVLADALHNEARANGQLGNWQEALRACERAESLLHQVEPEPSVWSRGEADNWKYWSGRVQLEKGRALQALGEHQGAHESWERAVEISWSPSDNRHILLEVRAETLLLLGRVGEARSVLQQIERSGLDGSRLRKLFEEQLLNRTRLGRRNGDG